MASITIDIPNAGDTTRTLDAFAGWFGYQATISSGGSQIPNPETKAAFAKRQVAIWAKNIVIAWESQVAADAARVTAKTSAEAVNIN
jgi:hypothetical protein